MGLAIYNDNMEQPKGYYAFISYKREDKKEAKWLQHALEYYRLPNHLRQENPELPEYVRPVFRDMTDLTVGELSAQIHAGLEQSHFLIVVCSPRAAVSKWVNDEVEYFISLGKQDKIIPYIIEGVPHASNPSEECYPPALLRLSKEKELLGANINEVGKDSATIRVVSRMFNIRFDTLFQRYQREQKKRRRQLIVAIVLAFLFLSGIAGWIWHQNVLLKDREWKMMENQARAVAEKSLALSAEGDSYLARLLLLKVLPDDSSDIKRPYVPEAERALREILLYNNTIIENTTSYATNVSFSPDGTRMALTYYDETIKIYSVNSGEQLGQSLKGHTEKINSVFFSPNGKYVVSASKDNTIRIWDTTTGEQKGKPFVGHTNNVLLASYSSDGKQIISVSYDRTIINWDAISGKQMGMPKNFDVPYLNSVAFGIDNKLLATGSLDGKIRIIDTRTGKQVGQPFIGHTSWVMSVSFSPDGKLLVSTSTDLTIRLWDVVTGQQIGEPIKCISASDSFSPDGKNIVSAGENRMVKIWDIKTRQCIQTFKGHTFSPDKVIYSPNGQYLASVSRDISRVWDIMAPHYNKTSIVFNITDWNYYTWDSSKQQQIQRPIPITMDLIKRVFMSSDGKWFLSISYYGKTIHIWNASTIKCVKTLNGDFADVTYVSFSPDGKRIVLSSNDSGIIRIMNVSTGIFVQSSESHRDGVLSTSFSPDGRYVVSASKDSTVRIWDTETGCPLNKPIVGHTSYVQSASFSPDGKCIVSASNDRTIRIWDMDTGRQLGQPITGHSDYVLSASYSFDGKLIVSSSCDKTIRIWDAETGNQIGGPFKGHKKSVNSASFSPDGKHIISASNDQSVRIWDVATGQCVQILEGHNDVVENATFCSDGNQITSIGFADEIIKWDFPSLQRLIDETRKRFKNRRLTQEERRKYYLE